LFAFDWPQPALEGVSALIIDVGSRLRSTPPGTTLRQRFRPSAADGTVETTPRAASRQACAFIASVCTTHAAIAQAQPSPTSRTMLDVLDALNAALEGQAPSAEACLTVTMRPRDGGRIWRAAAPVPSERLADVLRGVLLGAPYSRPRITQTAGVMRVDVGWHTRTLDADILHRRVLGVVPHRVLTDAGLPKSLIATPGPGASAIVTPRGQHTSYAVKADGTFNRMAGWPDPIVGELHGPQGHVAWAFGTPQRLMFRVHDDAEIMAADVAFQTYTAIWWQNHAVLTTSDGLWTWQPGRPPTKIADLAPSVIVNIDGDSVEVDPLPIEAGRLTRARLSRGWTVNLGTSGIAGRELLAPGQRWMLHTAAGRSVAGFPQADCLRLIPHAGAERTLIWPAPRSALWLGTSLLVNTTSGEVVFFEGLADVPEFVQS
jgi:hypothetical protein